MDPDMVLGGTWVWMSPLPQVAVQVTQIFKAPAAAWPLDNNMALDLKYHMAFSDKVWSCCPKDWESFSSHCYFISTDSASWSKSQEKCSSMGAHLMVVHSREEQDFITKILNRNAAYFIGLSDPGHRQWRWVDQTPYNESATFWHPVKYQLCSRKVFHQCTPPEDFFVPVDICVREPSDLT
ncbi:C-type lectin domain family 4 member A [Microtus ochrogaster]|uniref:C-type lectin domain family 4 member A n=1 Tax=Microtus ochrogaster TaxID=79684 RepID=A0A8J6H1Y1_MICOH|nr:C-type lectin domain family 4 member A [Microtus ochrogaster]